MRCRESVGRSGDGSGAGLVSRRVAVVLVMELSREWMLLGAVRA